jgi:hypothetical protein
MAVWMADRLAILSYRRPTTCAICSLSSVFYPRNVFSARYRCAPLSRVPFSPSFCLPLGAPCPLSSSDMARAIPTFATNVLTVSSIKRSQEEKQTHTHLQKSRILHSPSSVKSGHPRWMDGSSFSFSPISISITPPHEILVRLLLTIRLAKLTISFESAETKGRSAILMKPRRGGFLLSRTAGSIVPHDTIVPHGRR